MKRVMSFFCWTIKQGMQYCCKVEQCPLLQSQINMGGKRPCPCSHVSVDCLVLAVFALDGGFVAVVKTFVFGRSG